MDASLTVPRTRWPFVRFAVSALALACTVEGCQSDPPGNPLPPASVITGAEFVYAPINQDKTGPRVPISGDRCAELRGLFNGSRIDEDPARWAEWGQLRLFLKGGGTEVYTIYSTRKGPGAYADHLRRYFRGGSDAAFENFLAAAKRAAGQH